MPKKVEIKKFKKGKKRMKFSTSLDERFSYAFIIRLIQMSHLTRARDTIQAVSNLGTPRLATPWPASVTAYCVLRAPSRLPLRPSQATMAAFSRTWRSWRKTFFSDKAFWASLIGSDYCAVCLQTMFSVAKTGRYARRVQALSSTDMTHLNTLVYLAPWCMIFDKPSLDTGCET